MTVHLIKAIRLISFGLLCGADDRLHQLNCLWHRFLHSNKRNEQRKNSKVISIFINLNNDSKHTVNWAKYSSVNRLSLRIRRTKLDIRLTLRCCINIRRLVACIFLVIFCTTPSFMFTSDAFCNDSLADVVDVFVVSVQVDVVRG